MRTRAHQRGHTQVQRGLAAGRGNRTNTAFQGRDALLEHRGGGVADAAVDMPGAFQIEQRRRLVRRLEHIRGGEVDGHGAGAGGGVGLAACVQCQRVEMGIGVTGHDILVLTVL